MSKLSFKNAALLRKIKALQHGYYLDEMSQSEKDRINVLVDLGLVKRTFGVWSGKPVYVAA